MEQTLRIEALEEALTRLQHEQQLVSQKLQRTEAGFRRWRLGALAAAALGLLALPPFVRTAPAITTEAVQPVPKRLAALERAVFGVSPVPAHPTDKIAALGSSLATVTTSVTNLTTNLATVTNNVTNLSSGLSTETTARQNGDTAALTAAKVYVDAQLAPVNSTLTGLSADLNGVIDDVEGVQGNLIAEIIARQDGDESTFASATAYSDLHTSPLAALLSHFSISSEFGYTVVLTGANLQIVNGQGTTNTKNGLGNLLVGYNEIRNDGSDLKTGSHNLVLGPGNNYSSAGGVVSGNGNAITALQACALGGSGNVAGGAGACTLGGTGGSAGGVAATVTGGFHNTAGGDNASVSGGNTRSAPAASNWAAGALFQAF